MSSNVQEPESSQKAVHKKAKHSTAIYASSSSKSRHSRPLADPPNQILSQQSWSAAGKPLLKEASYHSLLAQVLTVEGPNPPEKFARAISIHKRFNTWTDDWINFKSTLSPKFFDPNSATIQGNYLYLACYLGDEHNARLALDAGADIHHRTPLMRDCPLNAALAFDHTNIVRILLEAGFSIARAAKRAKTTKQEWLESRIFALSANTLRILLDLRGKDIFSPDVTLWAAAYSSPSVIALLREYGFDSLAEHDSGSSAAHVAARCNRYDNMVYLLSVGFPVDTVDRDGQSAIFTAVHAVHLDMVVLLLNNGARTDIVNNDGTPLLHAAVYGHAVHDNVPLDNAVIVRRKVAVIRALCNAGTPLDTQDENGSTALHCSVVNGQRDIAAILVDLGASIEARDSKGRTPLHLCAKGQGQQHEIATMLLRHGAKLAARTSTGSTPLDLAKTYGPDNARMIKLLSPLPYPV